MKVIVDDKIPYIKGQIEKLADEVIYLPGSQITSEDVKEADALIIRTRTKCNKQLLGESKVKFIATATIGYDHIDTDYCEQAGIYWTNAPGCNSASVAQYLHSSLLLLQKEKNIDLKNSCIGVVGMGNVGSKVIKVAQELGAKVLINDPPLYDQGIINEHHDLEVLANECDIITFHTPLLHDGLYPTYHLVNETWINKLARKPILINTSRGEVVDNKAIVNGIDEGKISDVIIDVWENEPNIHTPLLERTFLGTPHIAGYSADGKANATRMVLTSLCDYFHLNPNFTVTPTLPETDTIVAESEEEAYLTIYNPLKDSQVLKQAPEKFEALRENYYIRREKEAYKIQIIP